LVGAQRWQRFLVTGTQSTYIFPTPSYTLVSAGSDETSDDVNCSRRPSLFRAAFCWRTTTSCCSAKAFFWPISCSTCGRQFTHRKTHRKRLHTFCKASFGIDILNVGVRDSSVPRTRWVEDCDCRGQAFSVPPREIPGRRVIGCNCAVKTVRRQAAFVDTSHFLRKQNTTLLVRINRTSASAIPLVLRQHIC
jgi:hypothetical protein